MPRIVKEAENEQDIKPYDFFAGFKITSPPKEEEESGEEEEIEEEEEEETISVEELLEEAREQAGKILRDAREQAEMLREQGYREGQEEGYKKGTQEAQEEQQKIMDAQIEAFKKNASEMFQSVTVEKERLLEQYIDDLKKISLTIAEKIIQTSLQSSGDIVKRMILAATDKITKKQWAKIYITKCNTGVAMDVDAEFLERLSSLSDNIKIVTMDNGEEGTCIIELPDEIIDASVGTQLENIKDILNNVKA